MSLFFLAPYQVESFESSVFPRIISICLVLFGILVILAPAKGEKQNTIKLFDPMLSAYFILVLTTIVLIPLYFKAGKRSTRINSNPSVVS
ncbi:MAG: hypothetical protein R6U13_06330 [Desulfatiglandaceae bacterium]